MTAIMLDIEGAFDNVSFKAIKEAMERHNIPKTIIRWYLGYLCNRSAKVELGGVSVTKYLTCGTPQGGILSPLVWNLVIDQLLQILAKEHDPHGFADDVTVINGGLCLQTVIDKTQQAIRTSLRWGKEIGLNFNPKKTTVMIFTKKRLKKVPKIKMGNVELDYESEVKILGVTITSNLTWSAHIKERARKAKVLLMKSRSIMRKFWGINPKNSILLYKLIIRTIMSYGSVVWASHLNKGEVLELDKVQGLALRNVCMAPRTSPTRGLEAILNMLPLQLYCEKMATGTWLRIRENLDWDGITQYGRTGHRRRWENSLERAGVPLGGGDHCDWTNEWSERDIRPEEPEEEEVEDAEYIVYTDGSRTIDGVGAGWAITRDDYVVDEESISLDPDIQVFQSEILAITNAIQRLLDDEHKYRGKKIILLSDSMSSLQALSKNEGNSGWVLRCRRLIDDASEIFDFRIRWVRGHNLCSGNELADHLAKRGSSGTDTATRITGGISRTAQKALIQVFYENKWNKQWSALNTCRQTKVFVPQVPSKNFSGFIDLHRSKVSLITQIVTGHCYLKSHLLKQGRASDDNCRLCGERVEDPKHIILECPALTYHRFQTLDQFDSITWENLCLFLQSEKVLKLFQPHTEEGDTLQGDEIEDQ